MAARPIASHSSAVGGGTRAWSGSRTGATTTGGGSGARGGDWHPDNARAASSSGTDALEFRL
jgi:hypothetical protein